MKIILFAKNSEEMELCLVDKLGVPFSLTLQIFQLLVDQLEERILLIFG